MPVTLGSERLLASGRLAGQRVGLVCNPASVDRHLGHSVDSVARHPGAHLTAISGPQHGLRSDVQDTMIETGHTEDAVRRVTVYSLHSEPREPTAALLREVDVVVIDLLLGG